MIPRHITGAHIEQAIRLIMRDGMPPGRRSRGYCLATKGEHLPPKYTIALAHQVATGELLPSDRFSGGRESNEFLRRRGFAVIECNCCGSVPDGPRVAVPRPTVTRARTSPPSRTRNGVTRASSGSGSFSSASTGRACATADFHGGRASQRTREPRSAPFSETWPGFWRDIADMTSARSCVPRCSQAVTTGFPTQDSSSSSMRASTSRALGSLPLPCTRTDTPWGSPRDAGWSFANNTTQGTTIPPSATNSEPGTTHCGTSSRRSWACSPRCGSTPATGSGARSIRTARRTGSASRT